MRLFPTGWQVAYRRADKGAILESGPHHFTLLKNSWRYMAADPFLFLAEGKTYIFAELYDYILRRGVIGFCYYDGEEFSRWKPIITEAYHLSYPVIFQRGKDVFMMPEAKESRSVYLYKAVEFPNRWEKLEPLVSDIECVDTTPFQSGGKDYAFTYLWRYPAASELLLFEWGGKDGIVFSDQNPISKDDAIARPGGKILYMNEAMLRVSQDCENEYGTALVFNKVERDFFSQYRETLIARVGVESLRVDKKICGVHTYNADGEWEVIDVKLQASYNMVHFWMRLMSKIGRVVRS